ncbi:hypothetical protein SAMN02927921_04076 [Sinomicrobium oceani]|uniref:Uncharacterized protein n=1 Tax=Sinomicrobium oceani TaxID=1150368 RepID=A0A1K1RW35_9FLAO|nr:hypothetical protein [Sinomicrobium oceani]SFW76146.1 hypothetical protein SAMN02927921_04076 [Sinomicrobium oceani]
MKTPNKKLRQLQQQWSAEMATFRELEQSNKALIGELHGLIDRLDIPVLPGVPGQ